MATKARAFHHGQHEQLSRDVLRKFRVIFGSVRHHSRRIEQSSGITGSQLWLVREVSAAPGIGVSALAHKLSIHQSTCSQLVDALVERGFLKKTRLGADQRRVGLTPTRAASKALAAASRPAEGQLPTALSEMSKHSLVTLNRQLNLLISELGVKERGLAGKMNSRH